MFTEYVLFPQSCFGSEGLGEGKITGVSLGSLQNSGSFLVVNYLTEYFFKPEY